MWIDVKVLVKEELLKTVLPILLVAGGLVWLLSSGVLITEEQERYSACVEECEQNCSGQ